MWIQLYSVFSKIWEWLNEFVGKIGLDELVLNLYDKYVANIPEVLKLGLFVLLLVIIVLGVITFIKKSIKVFIVLAIVAGVIFIIFNNK